MENHNSHGFFTEMKKNVLLLLRVGNPTIAMFMDINFTGADVGIQRLLNIIPRKVKRQSSSCRECVRLILFTQHDVRGTLN